MKKKKIVKVIHTIDKLVEVVVENYDEFTYYYSPRFDHKLKNYALYDKETGFVIAIGESKQDLLNKYAKVFTKYVAIRNNPEQYDKLKTKYASMCVGYDAQGDEDEC